MIEVEVHLYQIYHGAKLFHDVIDLLSVHGLSLRKIAPSNHFDGDVVELDAWFSVNPKKYEQLDQNSKRKLAIIEKELGISPRKKLFEPTTWDLERSSRGWSNQKEA